MLRKSIVNNCWNLLEKELMQPQETSPNGSCPNKDAPYKKSNITRREYFAGLAGIVTGLVAGWAIGRYIQPVKEVVNTITKPSTYSFVKNRFQFQGAILEYNPYPYDTNEAMKVVDHILGLNANWIMLKIKLLQDSLTSTSVTYKDPEHLIPLKNLTKYLKNLGINVAWLPFLELPDLTWRGFIKPADINEWFESYGNIIKHLGSEASKFDTSLFMIGSELYNLENYQKKWRDLICEIRSVYSGPICYGVAPWMYKDSFERLFSFDWLKELDYFGVSAYFDLTTKNDPSTDELVNAWLIPYKGREKSVIVPSIVESLSMLNKYTGRPIIFSEVGYRSINGANKQPGNYEIIPDSDNSVDFKEQADCYEALFRVFSDKSFVKGFFIWEYPTDITLGDNNISNPWHNNKGFTPLNKPAEYIIKKYFSNSD